MMSADLPDVIQGMVREFSPHARKPDGFRTPLVRKVSARYFEDVRKLPKKEVFGLCETLLSLGDTTEGIGWGYRTVGFDWAFRIHKLYTKSDFARFQSWFKRYVKSWDGCDDFCTRGLGYLIFMFPELTAKTRGWALSRNRWLRRGAAVSLIYSLRRRQSLDKAFEIADILLLDRDDMVQKGYGWMLKEGTKHFPSEVFNYVMKHKKVMPRTALRYAIEKLSAELKKRAMSREGRV